MKDRNNKETERHIHDLIDKFKPEKVSIFLGEGFAPVLILDKSKNVDDKEGCDCQADLIETGRSDVQSLVDDLKQIIQGLGFSKIEFNTSSGNTITFIHP